MRPSSLRWMDEGGVKRAGERANVLTAYRTRCGFYPPVGSTWVLDHRNAPTCLWCAR